jgi:mRNA interferase MazF
MELRRGDLVTIAVQGDYGKPRPALVVQADEFAAIPSVTVLRITSEVHAEHLVRVTIPASSESGLQRPWQICIDKAVTVPRSKIGKHIGRIDHATLQAVNAALVRFFGLS